MSVIDLNRKFHNSSERSSLVRSYFLFVDIVEVHHDEKLHFVATDSSLYWGIGITSNISQN